MMRDLVVAFCLSAGLVAAQDDSASLYRDKLIERLSEINEALDGALGVAVIDEATGTEISLNGEARFPVASVIKVPIMAAVFEASAEGALKLESPVSLAPSDAVAGGVLAAALSRGPITLTVRELVEHMIRSSDNTATNQLIELAGMSRVNSVLRKHGLERTQLKRRMLDAAAVRRGDENLSTPLELARLGAMLSTGKLQLAAEMTAIMKQVDGDVRKTVPSAIAVASKDGEYPGTRAELAIVYLPARPYVIAVCGTFLRPGTNPVPEVAAAVHDYFERLAHSNAWGNRID
jgi:beta-lactamase class A